MSYLHRLIILTGLLYSSSVYAFEFFADALYWRATEPVDWVLKNNRDPANQNHTYETVEFNFDPGFRVGVSYEFDDWDTKFYYTKFYTKVKDATSGNLTSTFLAGKIVQPAGVFYFQSGTVDLSIDFNIFAWEFGKSFEINDVLILRPLVGLTGGWINQTLNNTFQGEFDITENIKNDFTGAGPKMGIEGRLISFETDDSAFGFFAEFTTSYLWGNWNIQDQLNKNVPGTLNVDLGNRHFGSLVFQGIVGADFEYQDFSIKLSYEINDWFDQCQFFDDATGPHNNDLILQGLTLELAYDF